MKIINKKLLDYVGLIINHLRKRRVWGAREGLDYYPSLKHLIQLLPGDWENHMEKLMKRLV